MWSCSFIWIQDRTSWATPVALSSLQRENKMLKWSHCTGHSVGKHKHLMLGCLPKINDLIPALEAPVYLCWVEGILEGYSRHSQSCFQYHHLYLFLTFPLLPDCHMILQLCQLLLCRLFHPTWKSWNRTEFKGPLWFELSKSYPVPLLRFCLQQRATTNLKKKLDKSCLFSFSFFPLWEGKKGKDQVLIKYR